MFYEMLTGTRPQGAFEQPSIRSRVDARLDEVVIKAMRQEPERRYQPISELRESVARVATQGSRWDLCPIVRFAEALIVHMTIRTSVRQHSQPPARACAEM